MTRLRPFGAVIAYEFRMQIRRRAVWVLLGLLSLPFASVLVESGSEPLGSNARDAVAAWAGSLMVFLPIGVGVLLADRFPRDRRVRVTELLASVPLPGWAHLLGKYVGATLATIAPVALLYVAGVAAILADFGDPSAVGQALLAFLLVMLPGLLFVAAFSIACPTVFWVPLYQFLYIGYWFWGNLLAPSVGIPTLSDTPLTPIGRYAQSWLQTPGTMGEAHSGLEVLVSLVLLLGGAVAALVAGWIVVRWQEERA